MGGSIGKKKWVRRGRGEKTLDEDTTWDFEFLLFLSNFSHPSAAINITTRRELMSALSQTAQKKVDKKLKKKQTRIESLKPLLVSKSASTTPSTTGGKSARARNTKLGLPTGTKDDHRASGQGPTSSQIIDPLITIIEDLESQARLTNTNKSSRTPLTTDVHGSMITPAALLLMTSLPPTSDPHRFYRCNLSLRSISLPPSLTLHTINLTSNELSALPSPLPPTVHTLNISRNWFTSLPSDLPLNLLHLDASHNLLR